MLSEAIFLDQTLLQTETDFGKGPLISLGCFYQMSFSAEQQGEDSGIKLFLWVFFSLSVHQRHKYLSAS